MTRNKSLLIFACLALSFGFAQSAFSQWWPATGTDTDNNWGSGGWGSNVEIYVDQAPLEPLTAPEPDCKGNPKNCQQWHIFKSDITENEDPPLPTHSHEFAPKLNGLQLGGFVPDPNDPMNTDDPIPNCDAEVRPMFNAVITGSEATTPPTIAVCIIRGDDGYLIPETAAYCSVDIKVSGVSVSEDEGGACVYERTITDMEWYNGAAANIFGSDSFVEIFSDRIGAGLSDESTSEFPDLTPTNVSQCDFLGTCTLNIGLPSGEICPEKGKPNCKSNLFPAEGLFDYTGQVLAGKEDLNILALRYCVSDVNGDSTTIACDQGDKQVETADAVVIIECTGSHSPSKASINQTGGNTHKFNFESNCFPELATATGERSTIEFETIVDNTVTASGIFPVNDCQFSGDSIDPSLLTCFILEKDLTDGCRDDGTGEYSIEAIRGRAVVEVTIEGQEEPQLVPLIATDDNGGDGYLCKNFDPSLL